MKPKNTKVVPVDSQENLSAKLNDSTKPKVKTIYPPLKYYNPRVIKESLVISKDKVRTFGLMNAIAKSFTKFDFNSDLLFQKLLQVFLEYPFVTFAILESYLQQHKQSDSIVKRIKENMIYFQHKSMMLHSKFMPIKDQLLGKKVRFCAKLFESINPDLKQFYVPTEFMVIEIHEYQDSLDLMEDMETVKHGYTFAVKIIAMEKQYSRIILEVQDTSGTAFFVLDKDQIGLGEFMHLQETIVIKNPVIENGILYYGPQTILYALVDPPCTEKNELQGILGHVKRHVPNDEMNSVFTIGLELETCNVTKTVYFYCDMALVAAQARIGHQIYVPQDLEHSLGSKLINISRIKSIPASSLCPMSTLDSNEMLIYVDAQIIKIYPVKTVSLHQSCLQVTEQLDDFEYCAICGEFVSAIVKQQQYHVILRDRTATLEATILENEICVSLDAISKLPGKAYRFALTKLDQVRIETMCIPPIK